MDYTVKTSIFEGSLDLLLELVTERKLFINDVSLSQVADDFVRYLEDPELQRAEYGAGHLGEMAEFILVASTLMLVKSRSLLPTLKLTEEEEESIHELEDRLALYARTKELSLGLAEIFGKQIIFEKLSPKFPSIFFSPDSKTNTKDLLSALEAVIESLPRVENLPKITVKKVISLEEMIEKLAERVSKAGKFSFREMKHKDKLSMIVGFLAMLELVKRGAIRVAQESPTSDIEIESEAVTIPNYA